MRNHYLTLSSKICPGKKKKHTSNSKAESKSVRIDIFKMLELDLVVAMHSLEIEPEDVP